VFSEAVGVPEEPGGILHGDAARDFGRPLPLIRNSHEAIRDAGHKAGRLRLESVHVSPASRDITAIFVSQFERSILTIVSPFNCGTPTKGLSSHDQLCWLKSIRTEWASSSKRPFSRPHPG
jgi:hypothetical protein